MTKQVSVLPYDYSRCVGKKDAQECSDCRRREPGRYVWQVVMTLAPEFGSDGKCFLKIRGQGDGRS